MSSLGISNGFSLARKSYSFGASSDDGAGLEFSLADRPHPKAHLVGTFRVWDLGEDFSVRNRSFPEISYVISLLSRSDQFR